MTEPQLQGCPQCERARAENAKLQARIAELEADLAKAKKHSGNSSKPPSSDITSPPRSEASESSKKAGKRKRGGQKGHPRHQRPPFPPDQLDEILTYRDHDCPCCGGQLADADLPPRALQQVDIQEVPLTKVEHRCVAQQCRRCGKLHYPTLPQKLAKAGLAGPRLTALVGYLKGACHASFSTIRKFFRDVVGIPLSRGLLGKLIRKVSDSLQEPYDELLLLIPDEGRLNVDETGHKDNGKRLWTWCFRASLYTLFKISPSRGSDVLIDVLGKEFNGVLGCDYFSAYRKYVKDFNVTVQFCLAHFIRDVKFLVGHPDRDNQAYGKVLLEHLRQLFSVIHRREEYPTEEGFRRALGRIRNDLRLHAILHTPDTDEGENLARRFESHWDGYFEFITNPGVEPTNNLAEQAIRFVAIHRRLTQGTRSENGQTWCERIWTVVQTCLQQGRSVFGYLFEAVTAHFSGEPIPSLAPDTT